MLESHGASPLQGDARTWAQEWVPRITRPLRHPGNLKYVWALDKRARKHLPASLPYMKFADVA